MKCPKRRSQRMLTFFLYQYRDKQQTKNNIFFPFTCKPRISLEPQWYSDRTGRGGSRQLNQDAPVSELSPPPSAIFSLPLSLSPRFNHSAGEEHSLGESSFQRLSRQSTIKSLKYILSFVHTLFF